MCASLEIFAASRNAASSSGRFFKRSSCSATRGSTIARGGRLPFFSVRRSFASVRATSASSVVVDAEPDVPFVDVREQLRQLRLELVRRIRGIGAEALLRTLEPGAPAIPGLELGIARPHEHHDAIGLAPGRITSVVSGSTKPVRYTTSEAWRNG